jgi:hypothetical protein
MSSEDEKLLTTFNKINEYALNKLADNHEFVQPDKTVSKKKSPSFSNIHNLSAKY